MRSSDVCDVPLWEVGVKPDVVPAEESRVRVSMVPGHPVAQVGGFVGVAGVANLGQAHVLDEHMRRDRDDRARGVIRGVDQRDRRAVAVADEHRLFQVQAGEQVRQDLERLLVHERRSPRAEWGDGLPCP